MNKYIIYVLIDPRDGSWRYIGKSCNGIARLYQHLCASHLASKTYKNNWIKALLSINLKPIIEIVETFNDKESLPIAEQEWIAECRLRGIKLTNMTDGGDGSPGVSGPKHPQYGTKLSKAQRTKISEGLKGHKVLPQARQKLSLANMGNKKALGVKRTEESKKKYSVSKKGSNHPMFGKLQPRSVNIRRAQTCGGKGKFIDENGNVFELRSDAMKMYNIPKSTLSKCLNNKQKDFKGHTFKYIKESNE